MKILIWLGCAFIYGAVMAALSFCGISLGGIPDVLFVGVLFLLAHYLIKKVDRRAVADSSPCDQTPIHSAAVPPQNTAEHPKVHPVHMRRRPSAVTISILACLAFALGALNIYQYVRYQKERESFENEIESMQATIRDQSQIIFDLEIEANKVSYFEEIQSFLLSENAGYASEDFRTDRSVIIVSLADDSQKFTLTTLWDEAGTVSFSYNSGLSYPPASISFDSDSWVDSTSVSVHPNYEGAFTVTFSNNINDDKFNVLIVVTE